MREIVPHEFGCGAGRLVIKDVIVLGAALVTMADSAQAYLRGHAQERSHAIGARDHGGMAVRA
jgi:hypothetical protein